MVMRSRIMSMVMVWIVEPRPEGEPSVVWIIAGGLEWTA